MAQWCGWEGSVIWASTALLALSLLLKCIPPCAKSTVSWAPGSIGHCWLLTMKMYSTPTSELPLAHGLPHPSCGLSLGFSQKCWLSLICNALFSSHFRISIECYPEQQPVMTGISNMPASGPRILRASWGTYCEYFHFTDKKTKSWRGEGTFLECSATAHRAAAGT